jgi:hypothetical protein
MTCRSEEVDAMKSAAGRPPRLMTLMRANVVHQAASVLRAHLLNGLLSNCDGWHPERCRDVKDMRLAAKPLQISPQELLDQAEVCEFASDSVGRIATEVSEELGTELLHTTFEDLVRAGSDGGMGLPSSVESFLGLRPGEYEINVNGFFKGDAHKASHPKRKDGPRLAADILNFEEVRQYFEEHATPHRLQMLME